MSFNLPAFFAAAEDLDVDVTQTHDIADLCKQLLHAGLKMLSQAQPENMHVTLDRLQKLMKDINVPVLGNVFEMVTRCKSTNYPLTDAQKARAPTAPRLDAYH